MITKRHIFSGLLAALFLHLALLTPWLAADNSDGAIAEGRDGMLVSVGIAGSFAETAAVQEEINQAAPEEQTPEQQLPEEQSVTEQTVEEQPAEEQPETQQAETTPEKVAEESTEELVEPETAVTEPAPTPVPAKQPQPRKPVVKPEAKKTPAATTDTTDKTKQSTETTQTTQTTETTEAKNTTTPKRQATRATGIGERVETGGNPAARQSYLSKVLARIARFKRYPRSARKEGVTGTVTVTFVIQGNGSVLEQAIINSSGDSRLDQEALDMLLRASPFPPIPEELGQRSLELTLPVEFSLNPTRKLF